MKTADEDKMLNVNLLIKTNFVCTNRIGVAYRLRFPHGDAIRGCAACLHQSACA